MSMEWAATIFLAMLIGVIMAEVNICWKRVKLHEKFLNQLIYLHEKDIKFNGGK